MLPILITREEDEEGERRDRRKRRKKRRRGMRKKRWRKRWDFQIISVIAEEELCKKKLQK